MNNPQSLIRNSQPALLPVCIAGMDACWIFAVSWLFSQVVLSSVRDFPVPPVVVLILLDLGGWGAMLFLLDKTRLSTSVIRLLMGGVGLLFSAAIALALNPLNPATYSLIWLIASFFIGFISLALWMLGGYRATERVSYEDVYSNFRLGLIAISLAALLSSLIASKQINQLWTELGGVGLWFFVFGLAGLALGNREAVRLETGNAGMKSWGWLVTSSVVGILLLGSLGQAFGNKDILTTLQDIVLGVIGVIALAMYAVFYVLLWPFSLFNIHLNPVGTLPLPTPTPVARPTPGPLDELNKHPVSVGGFQIPAELQTIFMTVAAALVVLAIVYFMAQWLRRTNANRTHSEDEERLRFGSWRLMWEQIRAWFLRLLARFRRKKRVIAVGEESDLAALMGRPELAGTLSVRQIYARLLRLAGSAGYPRAPHQTPIEYLRFLSGALPAIRSELDDITRAYVEARYGPLPPSSLAVHAATTAWQRAEPVLTEERARQKTHVPV